MFTRQLNQPREKIIAEESDEGRKENRVDVEVV
jgi:hypothetical protein